MERDLVTGGSGLVGSFVVFKLLERGRRVRILYRSSSDKSWTLFMLSKLLRSKDAAWEQNIEWIEGDMTDQISLMDAVEGCSTVYHAAALVSFNEYEKDKIFSINAEGTGYLVDACLIQSTRPTLCYISSTATIGSSSTGLMNEELEFDDSEARSSYATSKYLGEVQVYRGREEGLQVVILNPGIILGFSNWTDGPSRFFKNGKRGYPFYTKGTNGFVDVRDVAETAIQLVERRIFNNRYLCIGENASYQDIFTWIASEFGSKKPRIEVAPWMAQLAWRLTWLKFKLTGKALITKSSAAASMEKRAYSAELLKNTLGYTFYSIQNCIQFHSELYKAYLNK